MTNPDPRQSGIEPSGAQPSSASKLAAPPHFSFAKLALLSLGAGVLVLVIGVPIIVLIAQWSPTVGLIVALAVVIAMIAAIATVSRRIVAAAERDILAYRESEQTIRDDLTAPRRHEPGPHHPGPDSSAT